MRIKIATTTELRTGWPGVAYMDDEARVKRMDRIDKELSRVNGKARAHTVIDCYQVYRIAKQAEEKLKNAGVSLKNRRGAEYNYISGEQVPMSYKHVREATMIKLARSGTGWSLVHASRCKVGPQGGFDWMAVSSEAHQDLIDAATKGFYLLPGEEDKTDATI